MTQQIVKLAAFNFNSYCQHNRIKPDNSAWRRYLEYLAKLNLWRKS